MEYVIYKDFNAKAICGEVNLPKGTLCTEVSGMIYHGDDILCRKMSENAYQHFARNNDGNGIERGELVTRIKETLAIEDEHTFERWHRVWNSPACRQFNNNPNGDTWVWNYAFYNAEIFTLDYILAIITDENWLGLVAPDPDEISDAEALAIITGGADE